MSSEFCISSSLTVEQDIMRVVASGVISTLGMDKLGTDIGMPRGATATFGVGSRGKRGTDSIRVIPLYSPTSSFKTGAHVETNEMHGGMSGAAGSTSSCTIWTTGSDGGDKPPLSA